MYQNKKSKREHLVETAQNLFYRNGIKGTGIDLVLEEASVAKRTLYNHFKSKDELVIATLKRRDEEFMDMLRRLVKKYESKNRAYGAMAKSLAFFDAIEEWTQSASFSGCMFINASAEYPRQEDPIHTLCSMHKKLVIQFIEELLVPLEIGDTYGMAVSLAVLADGAIVNAHTANISNAAAVAKSIAMTILHPHTAS